MFPLDELNAALVGIDNVPIEFLAIRLRLSLAWLWIMATVSSIHSILTPIQPKCGDLT